MAPESTPIIIREEIKLTSLGIKQQFITFTNVTMESEKYICIRETSPQKSVVIIDMTTPMQPLRHPFTGDSAVMNPNDCILALKTQIPGMPQDHLQILNMEAKTTMRTYQMPEQVVFFKWITPKMLGLVTETSVYHWSIEGESPPVKIFDRTANLANNHIISYQCDLTEKWFVLVGIKGSDPERPQLVKGNMQLFSVEHQRSLVKNAYAVAFTTFKVAGNDTLSTLICFASKITYASQISKLHVIELDPQPGMPGFGKKQIDFFFPQDFQDDFPVAIQISQKYSLIYVITKLGLLFVFDLETGAAICRIRISVDPIFLTTEAMASGGFYSINRKGQVLLAMVNDATIVSFVSDQIKNLKLALDLAKRANLPVANNLVLQRFHELLAQRDYREAAELVAESSQGLLRTPETVVKFQTAPVQAGQTHPLLQYFGTLLTKGKLNAFESLQLSCQLISQNKTNLLENWLDEDKLDCSEELGDIVKTVNNDLALKIYMKARAIQKVVATFAERSEFDKILLYLKQLDGINNFLCPEEIEKELVKNELENYKKLHEDMLGEIKKEESERRRLEQELEAERSEFEKQEKVYHNKLNELRNEASKNSGQIQEVEQKLFNACTKLKETEESLSAETKRRRETEEQLSGHRIELHNLLKSQQQKVQNFKDTIKNLEEKHSHLFKERELIQNHLQEMEQLLSSRKEEHDRALNYYEDQISMHLAEKADLASKLKETEESLSAETKKRRETEEQLAGHRIELHNLRKSQQQMVNEIEELKKQIKELEEFDLSVECGSSSSNHLEVNFMEFTYAELKAATDDFNDSFKIGEGGSGNVYKAFLRHTSVAIKILKRENRHGEREFNQEVAILSRIKHPNLVMLIGSCPEARALIYELMPNGSLHDILSNKQRAKTLTWKTRICLASNICSALIFLHSAKPHGIVHGDIKSANILVDSNNISKLSDFGICRQLYQTDTRITPHHSTEYPKGTLPYMDPEYLNSGELTPQYDIYSFGIVLLELVTGKGPKGLRKSAGDALQKGDRFVDTSAGKWPIDEAKRMMLLGLRCCDPSRKNRPDLVKEVWAEIESMQRASGHC